MAHAPHRLPASPNGRLVWPDLAPGRRLGAAARPLAWGPARGRGSPAGAECGDHREADGADRGKRGSRGSDGGKRIRGRKRHIVVDGRGRLLVVLVHSAGRQARDGAKPVRRALGARSPGLQLIWADGGYAGKLVAWVAPGLPRTRGIVQRPRHTRGVQALHWRGMVERTCGGLKRARRLSPDYEALPATTETWLRMAMIHRMVRRLAASA
jgi:Transposase DDE domain